MSGAFWTYWYFSIPNYGLAVLLYTLLGRFLLGFFLPEDSTNYIWRAFKALTDWILRLTGLITPQFIRMPLLLLTAAFWVFVVRVVFSLIMIRAGLAPGAASITG